MTPRRRIRRPPPTSDRRSPEERLEAMIREDGAERFERIWQRILHDLDANPQPGPWIAAARTLSDRLIISEDAYFYLAETFLETLRLERSASGDALRELGFTDLVAARHERDYEDRSAAGRAEIWREVEDEDD